MNKIIKFLNSIFAPRQIIYINDKRFDKMPEWVKKEAKKLQKAMNEIMDEFAKDEEKNSPI